MAGIMTYPFLEDLDTIKFMRESRVMIFLGGFVHKGDESSSLSRKFIEKFPDSSRVLQFSRGVSESLDEAIKDGVHTIVIDNASGDVDSMQSYYTVAHENHYIELALKAGHQETCQAVDPTFCGWFLNYDDSQKLRKIGQSVLQDSFAVKHFADDFREHLDDPTKDLPDYFSTKELDVGATMLHCTSMHHTVAGFEDYTKRVAPYIGKVFQIEVIGFLITPRTFGARLKLGNHSLGLWERAGVDTTNGWESSPFSPTNGHGSRAHMTLETGPEVQAVQTGLDLVELVKLEVQAQQNKNDIPTSNITHDSATLLCYGKGQAMVYLKQPMHFSCLFSGYSLKRTVPTIV